MARTGPRGREGALTPPATAASAKGKKGARAPPGRFECPRCGAPFAREEYRDLHLGRDHPDSLAPEERARYEAALAAEEAWLASFRRHVVAGMKASPIALVFLLVLLIVGVSGIPIIFGLLLAPGAIGFGFLVYYVAYSKDT